ARSRAVEYWPGIGSPFGFRKCEWVAPRSCAFAFILSANASMLPALSRARQINPLINFPRSNIQPHWLCESVDRFYSNRSIEVTGFRNNQRGQQLLCARGRPRLIGVFLV